MVTVSTTSGHGLTFAFHIISGGSRGVNRFKSDQLLLEVIEEVYRGLSQDEGNEQSSRFPLFLNKRLFRGIRYSLELVIVMRNEVWSGIWVKFIHLG